MTALLPGLGPFFLGGFPSVCKALRTAGVNLIPFFQKTEDS